MKDKAASTRRWHRRRDRTPGHAVDDPHAAEQATIDAARRGDLRAWWVLTSRYQELIYRSAYLSTRDSASAEEVTKATFMRAFRSLQALEDRLSLRPWLMGIAATVARTHLRELSLRRDAKVPDPDPCPRFPATPSYLDRGGPRPTHDEHEALVAAFDGMVDEDRLVIALRYGFRLPRGEAAARLGIAPDQVDGRLRASIQRLRTRTAETMALVSSPNPNERPEGKSPRTVYRLALISDDQLGSMAMAAVLSELQWTPDVAPAVSARLAREALAYPEQRTTSASATMGAAGTSTTSRPRTSIAAAQAGRGPLRSNGGRSSMMTAAVTMLVGLIGLSLVADGRAWDVPADLGARLGALFDEVGPSAAMDRGGSPVVGSPLGEVELISVDPAAIVPQADQSGSELPAFSIVAARTLPNGDVGARVSVDWSPGEGLGPRVMTRLERQAAGGAWKWVASADGSGAIEAAITPGERVRYRVRSTDEAGTVVTSATVSVKLVVRDPRSRSLALAAGEWDSRRGTSIKRRLIARSADASFSTEFKGTGVALVGPTGPTRGAIGIRVDGGPWLQGDLRTWATSPRTIVFSQQLEPGRHTLDVRALAEGLGVDAVLIVRTSAA